MTLKVFTHDLPKGSVESPLIEVEAIFDACIAKYSNAFTISTYKGTKSLVLRFLESDPRFSGKVIRVGEELDEYFLVHFETYMDFQPYSSYYRATTLSVIRGVLSYAVTNSFYGFRKFLDIILDPATRETKSHSSYSEIEFQAFDSALDQELLYVEATLPAGYIPTGRGRPPKYNGSRFPPGWSDDEDNLRWWFENKLECKPFVYSKTMTLEQKKFHVSAQKHGGTRQLFLRWGVTMGLDGALLMPYLFKLVTWTGLNSTPAQSLKRDDYVRSHPLTGKPCLYYWKGRGQGDLELHEALLRPSDDKKVMGMQDVIPLESKQAGYIERIWSRVEKITEHIRPEPAPAEDYLFIYMPTYGPAAGQVRNLLQENRLIYDWCGYMVKKYGLVDSKGHPLDMNIARLRPSLVSRLLGAGVDISVIQAILGHSNVVTTMRYIDRHNFAPSARQEIHKCLSDIRRNRESQLTNPKPIATEGRRDPALIFSTATALCVDVFDPPSKIKKAVGWQEGQACTYFNMCLRCSKVVILAEHLPRLFAMQRGYQQALEAGAGATTHRSVIMQNLNVLDGILGENSDFSEPVLANAQRQSISMEVYMDPFLVRGTYESK
jgi:integrase/ribosomal protein S27AE